MSSTILESIALAAVSIGVGTAMAALMSSGELILFQVPEYLVGALASGLIYWLLAIRYRRGEAWFAAILGVAASVVAAVMMAVWVVLQTQGDGQAIVLGFLLLWTMYGLPLGAAVGAGASRLLLPIRDRNRTTVRNR